MTNQFINQPADDWAKQNLGRKIKIKPLYNSLLSRILVGLALGFLALVFLGIPALIFYGSAVRYAKEGWSREISRGFIFGGIFLLAFILFTAFLLFYVWLKRRNQVTFLTSEGVFTRDGKNYHWKDLHHLNFKHIQTAVRGDFFLRLTTRAMYLGVQKIMVEMIFADGTAEAAATAVIPPLIADQREILELLHTIPVERRIEGP